MHTLNIRNPICQLYLNKAGGGRNKLKCSLFTWHVPFYLNIYIFQFLYKGLLRIAVPNRETELTTHQQMSFSNWSLSTVLLYQFQLVIFFFCTFQLPFLYHQFHFPFSPSDEPLRAKRTNIFHFACIKIKMQDTLSFWMPVPMQMSVWFIIVTSNIFLLCGSDFAGVIYLLLSFFFFLSWVHIQFSSWDQHWLKFANISTTLSKYCPSRTKHCCGESEVIKQIKSLVFMALIFYMDRTKYNYNIQ